MGITGIALAHGLVQGAGIADLGLVLIQKASLLVDSTWHYHRKLWLLHLLLFQPQEEEEELGEIAQSPTVRSLLDSLMLHPSTAPSPKSDGPADPSPDRGIEGTLPRGNDLKSVAAPEDSKDSGCGFILDSGVAEHATGSAELLSETRAPENGGSGASFRTRVGKDLPVVAVGSINTPLFAIPDVRHVPDLGTGSTLVSVRQLALRGLAVTFGSESCHVKEPSTGVVVGEGRLRDQDGFYYLDFLRIPQN